MGLSDCVQRSSSGSFSSVSLSTTRNMFSRYLPQWPEVSQSFLSKSSGVLTSTYPLFRVSRRMASPSRLNTVVPLGSQKAAPGAYGWKVKSPRCGPSLRWSRLRASSIRVTHSSSSFLEKKEVP